MILETGAAVDFARDVALKDEFVNVFMNQGNLKPEHSRKRSYRENQQIDEIIPFMIAVHG